jgi:alcohol dehydrogenase YqhD (iron-dependent ADH family)
MGEKFGGVRLFLYTDMVFGRGAEAEAGRMVRKHGGSKVMLVSGGGSIRKSGLYDRVTSALRDEGLPFVEASGVRPNPRRAFVDEAVKTARAEKADFFLAVGGGSVIDTAKAIALAAANGGDYWRFWNGTPVGVMAPVGAIPTIAAAGSEMSRSAVLVDDTGTGEKRGITGERCRPVFALLNPELTFSVSPYQTGAGAADIFAHTFMRYFWHDDLASALGDEFAEGLLRTVVKFGPIAVARPDDYEARAELMLAACLSHCDITQGAREGRRGGEHPLEHQLSARYDTAHGAGLAVMMPALLRFVAEHGPEQKAARAAQFLVKVFHAPLDIADPRGTALGGLPLFRDWLKSLGMPVTLKELGVPAAEIPQAVERCVKSRGGRITGFLDLDEKAIAEIYTLAAE